MWSARGSVHWTKPQPSILMSILNIAALAAASPTLLSGLSDPGLPPVSRVENAPEGHVTVRSTRRT